MANQQIQLALAREIAKAITAQKIAKNVGKDLQLFAEIGLSIVNVVTGEADTRTWLSLPGQINFNRISLPAGQHNVVLKSELINGQVVEERFTVNIQPDKPSLLTTRTFDINSYVPENNTTKPTNQTSNAN